MTAITLDLHSIVELTLEQFYQRTRSRIQTSKLKAMELLQSPTTLSGEDVLPGFVLDLQGILY